MEYVIAFFTTLWLRIFKRKYLLEYRLAQRKIKHAYGYLYQDYSTRASVQSFGTMLPEHKEALMIIDAADAFMFGDIMWFKGY